MRTPEDEAWEEMERRQGGGFPAKRRMAADKLHWSDCAVHNGPAYPAGECDCGAAQEPVRKVLKLALEALETERDIYCEHDEDGAPEYILDAITAIKEALAQPAQEQPVHMEMPEPEGWYCYDHDYPYEGHKYHTVEQIQKIVTAAVEAERKALAQPAQEPVAHFGSAYVNENGVHITTVLGPVAIPQDAKLYTASPQREWVGLTDDELADLWYKESLDWMEFARAHETALKEKNNGT